MSAGQLDCDVLIIGGGPVGAALAHALAQIPLDTVLVEARDPALLEQPSFDDRMTALASGSRRILGSLGLWDALHGAAEPIRSIHVSERGRFGAARITAAEERVAALGYTVENRELGACLWRHLPSLASLRCLTRARLATLERRGRRIAADVDRDGVSHRIRARLLVAADGSRSKVRELCRIGVRSEPYGQGAIVVNCLTEIAHAGRAFERFTAGGPLAVLPLTRDRVGVVWTLPEADARRAAGVDEAVFRRELQRVFGFRLGRMLRTGQRAFYPLSRIRSTRLGAERLVLTGSAAVNLHPVAGQGFNLALRDVATLAEVLSDAVAAGEDPGGARVLERYRRWRSADQQRVAALTHGLIGLFGLPGTAFGVCRGLGLTAFDLLPVAKAGLARCTMGRGGRLPRLARDLPLGPSALPSITNERAR